MCTGAWVRYVLQAVTAILVGNTRLLWSISCEFLYSNFCSYHLKIPPPSPSHSLLTYTHTPAQTHIHTHIHTLTYGHLLRCSWILPFLHPRSDDGSSAIRDSEERNPFSEWEDREGIQNGFFHCLATCLFILLQVILFSRTACCLSRVDFLIAYSSLTVIY